MLFAGIDVGSTTSKCVLPRDDEIAGSALMDMGIGTGGLELAYAKALSSAGAAPENIACCVATGYLTERAPLVGLSRLKVPCFPLK